MYIAKKYGHITHWVSSWWIVEKQWSYVLVEQSPKGKTLGHLTQSLCVCQSGSQRPHYKNTTRKCSGWSPWVQLQWTENQIFEHDNFEH